MVKTPSTLAELVAWRARADRNRTALVATDRTLTYGELGAECFAWAEQFHALGARAGDRVAFLLPNLSITPTVWLGATCAGAVQVPLNVHHKGAIQESMLDLVEPTILVVDPAFADNLPRVLPTSVKAVVPVGRGPLPESWPVASAPPRPDSSATSGQRFAPAPHDPAAIMLTSGTTGRSKGALCSHQFLLRFARTQAEAFELGPDDVLYNCLPQFHSSGQVAGMLMTMLAGGRMVMGERFSRTDFWRTIGESGATFTLALGGMLTMLESLPPSPAERAHRLHTIFAIPAPKSQVLRLEGRYGVRIRQSYGSTEQGIVAHQPMTGAVPGTVGTIRDHVELRIVDDDGAELPAGQVGAIAVRPHQRFDVFTEYWRDPEATERAFADGWFHSGDRGRLDEAGLLQFIDRSHDVIRRRGEHVSALELEALLMAFPGISQVAVIGVPSEVGEEDIAAFIVPTDGARIDEAALIAECASQMAYFMVPRYLEFVDELPLTPTQKIRKEVLRARGLSPQAWDRERAGIAVRPALPKPLTPQRQEETMDDRQLIADLLAQYCWGFDGGDVDLAANCFTADAAMEIDVLGEPLGRFDGRDAIRAMLAGSREAMNEGEHRRHTVTGHRYTLDGDAGSVASYVVVSTASAKGVGVLTTGWQEDQLRRTGDGWRITTRRLHLDAGF